MLHFKTVVSYENISSILMISFEEPEEIDQIDDLIDEAVISAHIKNFPNEEPPTIEQFSIEIVKVFR